MYCRCHVLSRSRIKKQKVNLIKTMSDIITDGQLGRWIHVANIFVNATYEGVQIIGLPIGS